MISNFSQLKKYLASPNACIELLYHSFGVHKWLNVKRKVIKVQSNAVKLEGGSWLGLGSTGEKASDFKFNLDNTFDLLEEGKIVNTYKYY